MPRPLFLLLAVLLSATVHGQEAKKPSPAVTRILDEAVRAVKRNRVDFDKANQKPLGEARKALEDLSTKLIKDGKAEEATAVLRQVGTLEVDVMRMANAPAPFAGGGAVQKKPLGEAMLGKWTRPGQDREIVIQQDGVGRQFIRGRLEDTAQVTLLAEEVVEIRWASGWKWRLRVVDEDMLAGLQWDQQGNKTDGVVFERIK